MPALGLNHLGFGFVLHVGGASTIVIRPLVKCFASLGPTVMHAWLDGSANNSNVEGSLYVELGRAP